jgi:hypothetical protein
MQENTGVATVNLGGIRLSASGVVKSRFSFRYLNHAQRLVDRAAQLEQEGVTWDSEGFDEHFNTVVTSIFMSSAFLETAANEVFADVADDNGAPLEPMYASLTAEQVANIRQWWSKKNDRKTSPADKYLVLLEKCGHPTKELKESAAYSRAVTVTKVRNELIHYNSFWQDPGNPHEIERRFVGVTIEPSPMFPPTDDSPWWPRKALGAGLARWCSGQVLTFASQVFSTIGIEPAFLRSLPRPGDSEGQT